MTTTRVHFFAKPLVVSRRRQEILCQMLTWRHVALETQGHLLEFSSIAGFTCTRLNPSDVIAHEPGDPIVPWHGPLYDTHIGRYSLWGNNCAHLFSRMLGLPEHWNPDWLLDTLAPDRRPLLPAWRPGA